MQFGVCGDPKMAVVAKSAGFDYFEWSVGGLLNPRSEERDFLLALETARSVDLPCPALNVFIPADLKITGPEVNQAALEDFIKTALKRAQTAGVDTIVFGSGGARRIPDGFDREIAWQQLIRFCSMLAPEAAYHGVKIAIEPLNLSECNVLNTVEESALLAREVNHPNIRLLVDGYHWAKDGNTSEGVLDNADLLIHAHIAAVNGRRPPNPEDPCAPFLTVLKQAGYNGRLSIEGNIEHPEIELPAALKIMQDFFAT